jgi:hypothetical protein
MRLSRPTCVVMRGLPADFKKRFPSLKDLYARLSDDLHRAAGAPDTFDKARQEIEEHFEARRLFKIDSSGS